MAKRVYFNWYEIKSRARNNCAAIIILTHAQTVEYNSPIAWGGKDLMRKLKIHHIPLFLFESGILKKEGRSLYCTYRTKEPQSYFISKDWLFANVSAIKKVSYLRALSRRRVSDTSSRIPRNYFNNITENPFLRVDEDYIYFLQESLLTGKP